MVRYHRIVLGVVSHVRGGRVFSSMCSSLARLSQWWRRRGQERVPDLRSHCLALRRPTRQRHHLPWRVRARRSSIVEVLQYGRTPPTKRGWRSPRRRLCRQPRRRAGTRQARKPAAHDVRASDALEPLSCSILRQRTDRACCRP